MFQQTNKPPNRLRAVFMPLDTIAGLLVQGREQHIRCTAGLPPDARCVEARVDPRHMGVVLWFEHESFAELKAGDVVPFAGDGNVWFEYCRCQPPFPVDVAPIAKPYGPA